MINNASIQSRQSWMEMEQATIHRQIDADLISPILFGRIIDIGSVQQRKPDTGMLPYVLCKVALEALTRHLAIDLAKDGITANLLAPGWTRTLRTESDFPDEQALIDKGQKAVGSNW